MANFIERLRERSESSRRMIAAGTSLAITLVIGVVWVTTSFPGVISGGSTVARANVHTAKNEETTIASFGQNVAQAFGAVKDQWGAFGDYFTKTDYDASNELQPIEAYSPEEFEQQKTTSN